MNLLKNGSFENGWTDIVTNYGWLVNQVPNDWQLSWLEPNTATWAISQKLGYAPKITTVPECIHKLNNQLPADEQLGGANALILDGNANYKMFAFNGIWAASLKQTINTTPNTEVDITIPVRVHYHGAFGNLDSPDEVEIWLMVNGAIVKKLWAIPDLPDRTWVNLQATITTNGALDLEIRFMTKWANSRDVFIDNLTVTASNTPPIITPPPTTTSTYNKINGFHVGIPAYTDGIGAWLQQMAQNNIPFTTKAVDNTGSLMDVQNLIQNGATGYAIWRHYNISGTGNDNPNYNNSPEQEATRYWDSAIAKWPPELDKNIVWLELINEPDRNKADWLGQVATLLAQKAIANNRKLLCFGWSSGEPEPAAWLTPGMQSYLKLCGQYPNQLGVSVHEYQFDVTKTLLDNYPSQIGRYQNIHNVCAQLNIAPPTIFITEFGWSYQAIPPIDSAVAQIVAAGFVYAPTNVKGAVIWALDTGANWGGVANQVHQLMWANNQTNSISPLLDAIKNNPLTTKHKAIVVKAPQEITASEWLDLVNYAYQYKHTMTASHDDALFILQNGNTDSYAKIYKPNLPSQQQFISLLAQHNIKWVTL